MDNHDKKILRILQNDSSFSTAEIGEKVGLSSMPVWRRIQRATKTGIVKRTVALLDRKAVGYPILAFVMLRTNQHDREWFDRLLAFVEKEAAIVEFHRMSGVTDFMLKVVLADMEDYRDFYNRMIDEVRFLDVSTSFAFETLKETTALPLDAE